MIGNLGVTGIDGGAGGGGGSKVLDTVRGFGTPHPLFFRHWLQGCLRWVFDAWMPTPHCHTLQGGGTNGVGCTCAPAQNTTPRKHVPP